MEMVAAVVENPGDAFVLRTVALDSPRDDEIIVANRRVGLCHTDIVAQMGAFTFGKPVVLGHEGAGTVEQVGAAIADFIPGDRVAISFRSCGTCAQVRGGPAFLLPDHAAAQLCRGASGRQRDRGMDGSRYARAFSDAPRHN